MAGSVNQNSRFDLGARKVFFIPAPKIVLQQSPKIVLQQYRPVAALSSAGPVIGTLFAMS
jgi:hypothetical protein